MRIANGYKKCKCFVTSCHIPTWAVWFRARFIRLSKWFECVSEMMEMVYKCMCVCFNGLNKMFFLNAIRFSSFSENAELLCSFAMHTSGKNKKDA